MSEPTVRVRRQWNDHRIATYRLADIQNLHWSDVSGGLGARAPQEFLSGYVLCDALIAGELAHACGHGRPPHRIKVCVTRTDNSKAAYEALLRRTVWDMRLREVPYLVDSAAPLPQERLAEIERWLDDRWPRTGVLTVGFHAGGDGRLPVSPQVWLSDPAFAKALAAEFGLRARGHQNQQKQIRMASLLAAADWLTPGASS